MRWRYWHARALEETGEPDKAKEIYAPNLQKNVIITVFWLPIKLMLPTI